MYRTAQGDFLGIGKLLKTGVRVIGGALIGGLTGGPGGAIRGAVAGTVAATRANMATDIASAGTDTAGDRARLARVHAHHAAAIAHHGAAPIGGSAAGTPMMLPSAAVDMGGGGGGGGGGRRRRMNVYNPRALTRANRRMSSFLHSVRKFVHFYKHQEGTPKFKKARKHAR